MPLSREKMRVYQRERRKRLLAEKAERDKIETLKRVNEVVGKVMNTNKLGILNENNQRN